MRVLLVDTIVANKGLRVVNFHCTNRREVMDSAQEGLGMESRLSGDVGHLRDCAWITGNSEVIHSHERALLGTSATHNCC